MLNLWGTLRVRGSATSSSSSGTKRIERVAASFTYSIELLIDKFIYKTESSGGGRSAREENFIQDAIYNNVN